MRPRVSLWWPFAVLLGLLIALSFGTSLAAAAKVAVAPEREVTVALVPSGSNLADLDQDDWSVGLMSAGMGPVPTLQTMLDIGQGARVTSNSYDRKLTEVAGRSLQEILIRAQRRALSAPRAIKVGLLNAALLRSGVEIELPPGWLARAAFSGLPGTLAELGSVDDGEVEAGDRRLRVVRVKPAALEAMRAAMGPDDTLIALEMPGDGSLLEVAVAGDGFSGELVSNTTHLVPLISSVDIAPTILERLGLPIPSDMEGSLLQGGGKNKFGSIPEVETRLEEIRSQRSKLVYSGLAAILLFCLVSTLIKRRRGIQFATAQTAVGLPLAMVILLITPRLMLGTAEEFLLMLVLGSIGAWLLRNWLGDLRAFATACGVTLGVVAVDLVLGLDLVPFSILGSNPIGGVRFFGIGNELESILAACLFLGVAAALQSRPDWSAQRSVLVYLSVTLAVLVVLVPGRFGADVGAVITLCGGAATACLLLLRRSWKLIVAVIAAPLVLLGVLAVIDLATGASSHFTKTIVGADSIGDVFSVLESRLGMAAHTVVAKSYRWPLILTLLLCLVLTWFSRGPESPLRRERQMAVGLYSTMMALLVGAVGNDSGTLLIMAGAPFVLSFWAMTLTKDWSAEGKETAPVSD